MHYKIIFFCLFITSLYSVEPTPDFSKERIIGINVGIRPFRKTGVRIEAEYLKDKLIIHNYGYGGAGLTLSFGGVQEVLRILNTNQNASKTVAILGAGVIGLTTAYDLLALGYEVHLYANDWSPNLTSDVAAGIWSPLSFPKDLSEEKKQFHARMLKNSEARFLMSVGESPEFTGVRLMPFYNFSPQGDVGEEIDVDFDNGVVKRGRKSETIGIEGQLFMNELFSKVKQNGATITQMHFKTLQDILDLEETVIINCTSMGSKELFNDQEFIPVRGQLVYFKPQKEIDYLYFQNVEPSSDDSRVFYVSIYPWSDRLILGGVYEKGESDPITTEEVINRIIQNAKNSLRRSE